MWFGSLPAQPEKPDIRPDTPRKKGLSRLAEVLGRDLGSICKAGLLALAACLPAGLLVSLALLAESLPLVLLAAAAAGWLTGPAMTGLYDTILRALRDELGYWWHTYRRAWKRSFRSSLLPGVAFTALWSCLLYARLAAVAVQLLYLFMLPRLGFFGLLTGLWLPSLLALIIVYPPLEHALDLEAKIRQVQTNR